MFYGAEIGNKTALQKELPASTTAKLVAYSTTNMAERKYLTIWNRSGVNVYLSFDSSVTSVTQGSKAFNVLSPGEFQVYPFGPAISVYMITNSGTASVSLAEIA